MGNKCFLLFLLCVSGILTVPVIVSGQNKYVVNILQPDSVQAPVISMVTVTSENKNLVMWEQTPNETIQYFKIYRDASDPMYSWINVGIAMYPGNNSFTDVSSFSNVRSYQYRISTVDICGNEVFNNRIHKTIQLNAGALNDTTCFLNWNAYEGFDIEEYNIYGGPDATSLTLLDSTPALATSYTGKGNRQVEAFYQVEAIGKTDTTTNETKLNINDKSVFSNVATNWSFLNSSDSTDAPKIHIYPNPLILHSVVLFPYNPSQKYQLSIIDLGGQIVYSKPVFAGEIEIERKALKEGMYILQIAGKKTFRKKLMVGRI